MTVEAVNSVIQTAPLLRANAEQTSTVATSGNPGQVQKAAQGPYVSPYVSFDASAGITVVEVRDTQTGVVTAQIPSLPNPADYQHDQTTAPSQAQTQNNAPAQSAASNAPSPSSQATAQKIAAFAAASQAGNTNAGNVSLLV